MGTKKKIKKQTKVETTTKSKKNSTSFKQGQSGNPDGAPKGHLAYDREELLAKKIDNGLLTRYFTLNSHLTLPQLRERLRSEQISSLERMIIRNLIFAARDADVQRMNFVLDRLVGKVTQPIDIGKKNPLDGLSIEQLESMKKELEVTNRQTMTLLQQTHPRVIAQEQMVANELSDTASDITDPVPDEPSKAN